MHQLLLMMVISDLQPDFVWIKRRSMHTITAYLIHRGVTKHLLSTINAEQSRTGLIHLLIQMVLL